GASGERGRRAGGRRRLAREDAERRSAGGRHRRGGHGARARPQARLVRSDLSRNRFSQLGAGLMPYTVVAQGENVLTLAWAAGLDWKSVWNHPSNAGLRQTRKDPNALLPRDSL